MAPQLDTISFSGSIAESAFALRRNQSFCSIHRNESIRTVNNIAKGGPAQFRPKLQHYHPEEFTKRFNNSFHHFRFVIVFIGGLAVGFMSLLRLNITVAIINMVNQTKIYLDEDPDSDVTAYFGEGYEETGEFEWGNKQQQAIISYYMIAYTLPQLLATKLAIKIGIKWSIPICVGLCALSCLLTPTLAYQGAEYVIFLRLINGLGASAILPMMVYVIEHWMPARESSLGLAILQFVQSILFTTSPLISGCLADIHWKWAFYGPAAAALVFCLIWLCLLTDEPKDCWLFSAKELKVICDCEDIMRLHLEKQRQRLEQTPSMARKGSDKDQCQPEEMEPLEEERVVPWTIVFGQKSFYALAAVWIFYNSSFGSFSFLAPSYMRQILKVPIMENGMLCFAIQAGCMISVIWPQPILRLLQHKLQLSLTASRRIVLGIICFVAVTTWLIVARYHTHQIILFSINRIFHLSTDTIVTATIMSQYSRAGISSIVYSVINAVGNFSTVFFCTAAGNFLDTTGQSAECWSWIFVACALMNVGTFVLFSTVITSKPIEIPSSVDCQPAQVKLPAAAASSTDKLADLEAGAIQSEKEKYFR